jgi:hypothetical protein
MASSSPPSATIAQPAAENPWIGNLELKPFATVGRSLVSKNGFRPGETVLKDSPFVQWSAAHVPKWMEALSHRHNIPDMLAAAAGAFLAVYQHPDLLDKFLDMHAPELPIAKGTLQLVDFSRSLATLVLSKSQEAPESANHPQHSGLASQLQTAVPRAIGILSLLEGPIEEELGSLPDDEIKTTLSEQILKAMMAAKVNSHRLMNGNWGLMPLGSKLAHSCDPNCMFIATPEGATFVAVKPIARGECLSFCYAGSKTMTQSTELRQLGLRASHLFLCRCRRCEGEDRCRQLPCPACKERRKISPPAAVTAPEELGSDAAIETGFIIRKGSALSIMDDDYFPDKLWRCQLPSCGATYSDADLASTLALEKKLEEKVLSLTNGSYQYKAMKALCAAVVAVLGRRHWCYVSLCHHFTLYFREMVKSGLAAARHLCWGWGVRYLTLLTHFGVLQPSEGMPHMLSAAIVILLAQTCGVVNRYLKPLSQMCNIVYPLLLSLYADSDPRLVQVAALAGQSATQSPDRRPAPTTLVEVLKATEEAPKDLEASEDQLFSLWDRFVVLMVLKQQRSNPEGSGGSGGGLVGTEPLPLAGTPSLPGNSSVGSTVGSNDSLEMFGSSYQDSD